MWQEFTTQIDAEPQSSEKMASAYMSVVNRQIINTLTYVGLPFKPTLSLHKSNQIQQIISC